MSEHRNNAEDNHPEELSPRNSSRCRLSDAEAAELASQVAGLAEAGLPLHEGLRALADESSKGKLQSALLALAERIESGMPLEEAIEAQLDILPENLAALVATGVGSGRLAQVLERFAAEQRDRSQLRRRMWQAFAYPILLLAALSATFVFLEIMTVPMIMEAAILTNDFVKEDGRDGTTLLRCVASLGSWLWRIMLLGAVLGFVLAFFRRRDPWIARIVLAIPLIGPAIRWNRMFHISRTAALLLKLGIPLPEVFRAAAHGTDDAYLSRGCCQVADEIAAGGQLAESMSSKKQFPPSMVALISWGEGSNSLGEAFAAASESMRGRAKAQLAFVEATLPSLVFLVVATMLCAWMSALYFGLVWSRIRSLTSFGVGDRPEDSEHFSAILWNSPFLVVFGVAVLVAMRLVGGKNEPGGNDPVRLAIRVIGWVLVAVGGTGIVVPAMFAMEAAILIPCTLGAIIFTATYVARREAQRKALLSLLATATERFMPLVPVLAAFASERRGLFARRARRLVKRLEEGASIPEALERGKKLLPWKSRALVHLGGETGLLAAALNKATSTDDRSDNARRILIGKCLCMLWLLCFALCVLTFFAMKIVPQFVKIFEEYDAELPMACQLFIMGCQTFGPWVVLVFFFLGTIFLYGTARYIGLIHWDIPGVSRFVRRLDTAAILDAMSLAVEHGKPLPATIESLSRGYPKWGIRRRLLKVRGDIASGADWADSLLDRKLIKGADFAVIRAATKAGNLPWAMRELAESGRRRFNYRIDAVLQFAVPSVVLVSSLFVGLAALFVILPMVALIQGLT